MVPVTIEPMPPAVEPPLAGKCARLNCVRTVSDATDIVSRRRPYHLRLAGHRSPDIRLPSNRPAHIWLSRLGPAYLWLPGFGSDNPRRNSPRGHC